MKIATVCGMGFGTSMMLALQIRSLISDENIDATVEPVDLGSFKTIHADIVVAPSDMRRHVQGSAKKVVLIDNLIDKAEVRRKVLEALWTS